MKKSLRKAMTSGSSLVMVGTSLYISLDAHALPPSNITISTSISTGTVWSGTLSPNTNLTVTSTGTINTANAYAVTITGTAGSQLGTLLNNGSIIDTAANGRAVFIQAGTVASVINNGTISASTYALWNAGSIGQMTNTGRISGRLVNQSTIGNFTNTGTLTYTSFTWDNESQIRTFTNSGLIYGDRAVYSQGTIGTLVNTGTIHGTINAVTITGVGGINTLSNTGLVMGNVLNSGTIVMNVAGGSGGTVGTFTGTLGSIGTFTSANANLSLSGNLLWNDAINVGTRTITADGAMLTLSNQLSITGTYTQNSGGLQLNLSGGGAGGGLVANRPVLMSNSTVTASLAGTGNFVAGNSTLVAGATGSSYTGMTYLANAPTGLSAGVSASGNNLVLTANNHYVGGTLGTLTNSGTIGSAYGLYVAGTGSLGTLSNTGTLTGTTAAIYNAGYVGTVSNSGLVAGDIVNASANALTIVGGSGATVGTLTGATIANQGTITSTLANVVFASGNLKLNDHVNVGSGTVSNLGASLTVGTPVSITGNFNQTAGTLALGSNGLVVSGAAVMSGGTVTANVVDNYLAGGTTLVQGGASSSYSGLTLGGLPTGLGGTLGASGNNLQLTALNDYIGGSLASLSNTGSIGAAYGVYVASTGSLGSLSNTGTITGSTAAIYNAGGTLGPVANAGVIAGDIVNTGTGHLTISGGTGATIGTLTGADFSTPGTITNTASNVVFTGGNLLLNDHVNVGSNTVSNVGASLTLGNPVSVTGNFSQTAGTLTVGNNSLLVSGAAVFSGGVVQAGTLSGTGNYLAGSGSTLVSGGVGSSYSGVTVGGSGVTGLVTSSTVSGNDLLLAYTNDYVGGALSSLSNTGSIGSTYGVYVAATGSLGSLSNTGTISGSTSAIYNLGTLGTLSNAGLIAGNIANLGASDLVISGGSGATVGTLTGSSVSNVGTITSTSANLVFNTGNLLLNDHINVGSHTVSNTGASIALGSPLTITGDFRQTAGTLAVGSNSLVVSGAAVMTGGTVVANALDNYLVGSNPTMVQGGAGSSYSGVTLGAPPTGLSATVNASGNNLQLQVGNDYIGASLASLSNTGSIGAAYGVYVASTGSLGSLSNTGTISGSTAAIYNAGGTLGAVANSGVIAGDIVNTGTGHLTISGGTGATIGTLTGANFSSPGTITNTSSNVVFTAGNLLLNDHVNVGGNTVSNVGASLALGSSVSVTGNFNQTAGTLTVGNNSLSVSGAAVFSGGVVQAGTLSGTGNYLAGSGSTLVSGGVGSSYSGVTVGGSGVTGLSTGGTVSGNNLLLAFNNDYIGGALSSLSNTGSIGAAYGVYVASTGSLGSLSNTGTISGSTAAIYNAGGTLGAVANSGVIAGDIVNASTANLSISGGSGATIGTLTGADFSTPGTITNTSSNVVFTGGKLLLNDHINVGSHTVSNTGAAITLGNPLNVTGNFSQTAGSLDLGSHSLSVSGAASLTGGTVQASLSGTGNHLAGSNRNLVVGGASSSYNGVTVNASLTGLATGSTVSGNTLQLSYANDYIGGALSSLSNTGSIGAAYGVYVASTGSLGSLSNTGTISGSTAAIYNAGGTLGAVANSGVIAGDIVNASTANLSISGGSGATIGTLTGADFSTPGTITNTSSNVVFTGGNLLLNDHINVGSHTVSNTGASIALNNPLSITGNFNQTAGTLNLGVSSLSVSGAAVFTGGTIQSGLLGTSNFLVGTAYTLVSGGVGSSYNGVSVDAGNITGLSAGGVVSGYDLQLAVTNDYVGGALGSLSNAGSIGGAYGVYVASTGSLGGLSNTGTITGSTAAIYNAGGTLGAVANTGVIAGDIVNTGTSNLSISGGTGATIGTLTGANFSSPGTITNTTSNVVFTGGNLLLNDHINVGSHTVSNTGAAITLGSPLNVTGNFSQTAGSLDLGSHSLSVSGAASLTGGTVQASLSGTGNHLAGSNRNLVVGGASSSYNGVTVNASLTGLATGSTVSGNTLQLSYANDYIGGALSSLSNTGSIGAAYGVYVASTGALGSLSNTGTITGSTAAIYNAGGTLGAVANAGVIAGDIVNTGTTNLSISGGTGTTIGTLTGADFSTPGTITNTSSNVVFTGGNLLLNDHINVGSHAVANSGASIALGSTLNVTGDFNQTAGSLDVGSHSLNVSGAASLTGGTVQTTLSATGNYVVGGNQNLVVGGASSTYAGVTVASNPITGLSAAGTVSGNTLQLGFANDYIGGALSSLSNTGSIGAAYGVYVASTGSLGSLSNTGTITGSTAAIYNAGGTLGAVANTGVIAGDIVNTGTSNLSISGGSGGTIGTLTGANFSTPGTITNTASNVVFTGGNLLLNDHINVGSHAVANSGASIALGGTLNVTGDFNQTAGNLDVGSHSLNVSGAASLTGGTVQTTLSATGNYVVGGNQNLVVGGASSTYAGVTVASNPITGLSAAGTVSGNTLQLGFANDYIGGALSSLSNTGSIGAAYGVYVASTGSLGSLSNTGTISGSTAAIYNAGTLGAVSNEGVIAGDITNVTAHDLLMSGASGSNFGTLTGASPSTLGTVTNTAANVVYTAGNLLLNDHINVGSHTVNNTGATLAVNNTVNITGNYTQGSEATLQIGVANGATANGNANDTGYGRLVVSGTASIASGASVKLATLSSHVFAQGQRFLVVQGGSDSVYNAATLNYAATNYTGGFAAQTITSDNLKGLLVCLGVTCSTASTATTTNAVSSLKGILGVPATNTALETLYNAAVATSAQGTTAANRAGAQLSVIPSTEFQATMAPTNTLLNILSSRAESIRTAQASGSSNAAFSLRDVTGFGLSDMSALAPTSAGLGASRALWGQAFWGKADQGERDDVSGYKANYNGLLVGADQPVSEQWRAGGVVSYVRTKLDNTGDNAGSHSRIDSLGLMGYGSYTTEQWYLNLSGGLLQHRYDTSRQIDITNFTGKAEGQHDGTQLVLSAQAGQPMDVGAYLPEVRLTPIAGLTYSYLRQSGYTESGSAAALQVGSANTSSIKSELGAKAERDFATSHGKLTPSVYLGWRHEYLNASQGTRASFAADASGLTQFTTTSARPIADIGLVSLGLTLQNQKNMSVAAKFDYEAGAGYQAQQAVNVKVRWTY